MDLRLHAHRSQILLLIRTAMVVFVATVVIGVVNGIDAVDFSHKVLLTHVHVGTLGWLTLNVFAASIWLFGDASTSGWRGSAPRVLAPAAVLAVIAYDLAFFATYGYARPVLGTIALVVITGFFVWVVMQARALGMSTVKWGFLVALASSVTGGIVGVLWGIVIASGNQVKALPSDGEGAHPATMVVGFLVPVAAALVEWWLRPDEVAKPATRGGLVQMLLLFFGGLSLTLGTLLDVMPLIFLNLPFEIVAVIIFLVRNRRSLMKVSFDEETATPFLAAASIWVVVNLGLLFYLIGKYAEDFDKVPNHLLIALDHTIFIGGMTNAIFGFILVATAVRRSDVLPWADRAVFWMLNVGLTGFCVGLVLEAAWPKRLSTPLMGAGILFAIGVYLTRSTRAGRGVAGSGVSLHHPASYRATADPVPPRASVKPRRPGRGAEWHRQAIAAVSA